MKQIINYLLLAFVVVGCHMEVPEEIIVDFSGISDKGKVTFTNKSKGAQSYTWDFGDGSPISTEKEPVHTYTVSRTYSVKLIAKGEGATKGKTIAIPVDTTKEPPEPVPAFTVSGDRCIAPCSVTFTNQSTFATQYQWNFGNNKTSIAENPGTIAYDLPAVYHVTLTATGPKTSKSLTKDITILSAPTNPAIEKVWDNSYGSGQYEQVEAAVATSDGGAVLVGRAQTGPGGTNEFKVVKINSAGDQKWDKYFGGTGNDAATAIIEVPGGFLVGGYSDSDSDKNKTAPKFGSADFWVVRIDDSGNKLWDKSYGGDRDDILKAIVPTSDGGFLLGGSSFSGANGNKSTQSLGNADFWVVKINASGDKTGDKSYGGSDDDRINCMANNNKVVTLAGYSKSTPNGANKTAPTRGGGQDYWVMKVNENGDKVGGDFSFGGSRDDQIYALSVTDRYTVGGESSSEGNTGNKDGKFAKNYGVSDFYVYRFDDTGQKTWEMTYGGEAYDKLHAMSATPDGGALLVGESRSGVSGNKTAVSNGDVDSWMIKVNRDGKIESEFSFGGSKSDKINCMVKLSDGTYLIAGESDSPPSGNKSSANFGFEDFWAVRVRLK